MTLHSHIEQNGYGLVPDIVSASETEKLVRELSHPGLPRSRAGIRHLMSNPEVSRLAQTGAVLNIVRKVLGEDAIPFRATLFDKSPSSNWLVMWHQDTALPLIEKKAADGWGPWSIKEGITYAHAPAQALEQVLAVRIHLDDSTLNNGPLRILPGTHTCGVLTDEELHGLSEKIVGVDCPIGRGGAIFMRPLAVHASSKSIGEEPRRVIHIEYAAKSEILPGMDLAIA